MIVFALPSPTRTGRHVQGQLSHRERHCLAHIARAASPSQRPLLARACSPSLTEAHPRSATITANIS